MVGLFLQQHYLPFNVTLFAENEKFQASRAESLATQWFKNGKFEEPSGKGKIQGFSDLLLKSMKSESGNATVAEVQVFCLRFILISIGRYHAFVENNWHSSLL